MATYRKLSEVIAAEALTHKRALHDISDGTYLADKSAYPTITAVTSPMVLTPADGWVLVKMDTIGYENKNTDLFDNTTGKILVGDVYDSLTDIFVRGYINFPSAGTRMLTKTVIPDVGGDIIISDGVIEGSRNNIFLPRTAHVSPYAGQLAMDYGVFMYMHAEGGNVEILDLSIKLSR